MTPSEQPDAAAPRPWTRPQDETYRALFEQSADASLIIEDENFVD